MSTLKVSYEDKFEFEKDYRLQRDIYVPLHEFPCLGSLLTMRESPVFHHLWRMPQCLQTLLGIGPKLPLAPQHVEREWAALSFHQQMRLPIARSGLPAAPLTELDLVGNVHTLRSFMRRAAVPDALR